MVRKKPEADCCIEENACRKNRKSDNCILEETEFKSERFKCRLRNHIARCADQGEVSSHRCGKYQRHQQAGAAEAGFRGNTDNHRNQNCSGACIGENTAHQSDNHHDCDNETALTLCELCDNTADFVGHSGFEQCTSDNEHCDEENDVAVDEAGEGSFDIKHTGYDKTDTDDHGCKAKRYFLSHEHDNCKCQKQ